MDSGTDHPVKPLEQKAAPRQNHRRIPHARGDPIGCSVVKAPFRFRAAAVGRSARSSSGLASVDMALELPPVALTLLKAAGAVVEPAGRASKAQLLATCKQHGYVVHPSVAAFEAAFGGLVIPDRPKQKKNDPVWLFGAHVCLSSDAHAAPRGGKKARGLVPVVYSPNDVVYFLDKQGRAYAQDTIEEPEAKPFAENGSALVARIMLYSALFALGSSSQALPGLQGDALAQRLSLVLVKEASDRDLRFFADATAKTLVVENLKNQQTLVASSDKKRLRLLAAPAATKPSKPTKPTKSPASAPAEVDLSHQPLTDVSDAIGDARTLRSLNLRGCPIASLPASLVGAKKLEKLLLAECAKLDVAAALVVIAQLPKLKTLSLPLSRSLTTLTPLAKLPLRSLTLVGANVPLAKQLPAGIGQLQKLTDLRIEYADAVATLPQATADVRALRLLFHPRFSDDDIRKSAQAQPEKKYLAAFVKTLA